MKILDTFDDLGDTLDKSNTRIILEHLANGGTLTNDGADFVFTRDAQQRFSGVLVELLIDSDLLRRVDGTFLTPGREGFVTITNLGRERIGKKRLYGSLDLIPILGKLPHQIDKLTWDGKLPAVMTAARKRIYDEQSLAVYRGEMQAEDLDAVPVFKVGAAAKVSGLSEVTVRKHVKLRLLYGYMIGTGGKGNNVMVFTSEQMVHYLAWLGTRNWRDQARTQ